MSKIEVNTVDVQCGSTLTLGSSGKTVTLATGASQSGFGRTGTVDWCSTVYTNSPGTITSVSGKGYFINTTSGAVTINLPSSPSFGDIISIKDYAGTFACNATTIGRGGSKINGVCSCATLLTNDQSITLIYVDGTKGWQSVQETSTIAQADQFITATGGTITTVCTNYKVHVFDSDATFTVTGGSGAKALISYMVVAGGAGGSGRYAGGSGGGGFREAKANTPTVPDSFTASPLATTGMPISPGSYPIAVGAGGTGGPSSPSTAEGTAGSISSFNGITSAGGGAGGGQGQDGGNPGGSGGGGSYGPAPNTGAALKGSGNTPPVSPAQGNDGGAGYGPDSPYGGGGGGGATEAGVEAVSNQSGRGGAGATTSITASPVGYSGGGGGSNNNTPGHSGGAGSPCGSGTGATPSSGSGNNAAVNRGGGGGSGFYPASTSGGNGGSGKVVIRYKFQ